MQIVLIEDNPLMQQLFSIFLRGQGFEVTVAGTGEAALVAPISLPAILLIDLRLPDYDGFELLQLLRARPELRNCPAIALSGLGESDRRAAFAAGFNRFLTKPADLDELLQVITELVGDTPAR
ncbi:response regulator [Chloroflexus sp.]|uniref:response regulator n=1 Tax=Chloroflexus sp. TaxID=1904827 RepID=UPI00260EF17F|nr:response regulator [uncultured Chloroflexus sp.]